MTETIFESAQLKIKRAEHHIREIEAEFAAYVATKPHRFSVQNNAETGQTVIRVRFISDPPKVLSLIIGDAIHNLRTALDHLTWEVVGIDGGTQDRYLTFRTGDDRVNFESSCKGIVTPGDWVRGLHISLEVFPGGKGTELYALHLLDNLDKHSVITPVLRATTHPDFVIVRPDGTPGLVYSGNQFIGTATADHFQIATIPPGCSVELQDDAQCTPEIFFRDIKWPAEPVIQTLQRFAQKVSETVEMFEAAAAFNP